MMSYNLTLLFHQRSGYLSDGGVHDMAHLVPILGRFESVSAFTAMRQSIHVTADTLATSIKLANGGIGVANFTFVSRIDWHFILDVCLYFLFSVIRWCQRDAIGSTRH